MAFLYSATLSFWCLNCMAWQRFLSTLHKSAWCNLILFNTMLWLYLTWYDSRHLLTYCRLDHSILAKSGIQICWQSRGRGRAQRGPRPLAWYELWCVRFQLITRGAFRFHARPGLHVLATLPQKFRSILDLLFLAHDPDTANCTDASIANPSLLNVLGQV